MKNLNLNLEVDTYFDKESNSWIVKSEEFKIKGFGKTINEAQEMCASTIKEILKPNRENHARRVNQLENNLREIRGQLIIFGVKECSCIIMSIDSLIEQEKGKQNP